MPDVRHRASMAWRSFSSKDPISSKPSTNSFKPLSVGIRPADVCGDANKPANSNSDMTFLTVADDNGKSNNPDNVFDPIGSPRSKYASTSKRKIVLERSFNSDNVDICLLIVHKCSNRIIKRQRSKSD